MYRAIGAQKFVTYFGFAVGAVFVILWLIEAPSSPTAVWRQFSLAASVIGAVALLVGQTPLFPWLCRRTPLRQMFPDIDGSWRAELHSNWPTISQTVGLEAEAVPTIGRVTIKARLFTVKLRYRAISPVADYLTSKTRSVSIERDPEDGVIRLFYIFEAEVRTPADTDTSHHYGAAYLDLLNDPTDVASYSGVYWTNRKWVEGLNTAGTIDIRRCSETDALR